MLSTLHDLTLAGQYADRLALLSRGPGRRRGRAGRGAHPGRAGHALRRPRRGGRRAERPDRAAGPMTVSGPAGSAGCRPGRSWAAAGRSRRHDHGQHRVAAGHRVVGEEQHRRAVRRHLHARRAPAPRWAARPSRARASAGPASRSPTRLLSAVTVHSARRQRRPGVRRPASPGAGPGSTRSTGADDGGAHRRDVDERLVGRAGRRPAAGRRRASGAGPSPERVSVLREPSTGGTSMPPRTAR